MLRTERELENSVNPPPTYRCPHTDSITECEGIYVCQTCRKELVFSGGPQEFEYEVEMRVYEKSRRNEWSVGHLKVLAANDGDARLRGTIAALKFKGSDEGMEIRSVQRV